MYFTALYSIPLISLKHFCQTPVNNMTISRKMPTIQHIPPYAPSNTHNTRTYKHTHTLQNTCESFTVCCNCVRVRHACVPLLLLHCGNFCQSTQTNVRSVHPHYHRVPPQSQQVSHAVIYIEPAYRRGLTCIGAEQSICRVRTQTRALFASGKPLPRRVDSD